MSCKQRGLQCAALSQKHLPAAALREQLQRATVFLATRVLSADVPLINPAFLAHPAKGSTDSAASLPRPEIEPASLRAADMEMEALRAYVTAPGTSQNQADSTVRLHVTHSNLRLEFMELRLDKYVSVFFGVVLVQLTSVVAWHRVS